MVEDEALILEIMAETLDEAGYDVVTAPDGVRALELLNEDAARFDVLFSDYHLPGGLTGLDLALAIWKHFPSMPVILATGRPDVRQARWPPGKGFILLRKPYGAAQMVETMGKLLPPHRPPA